MLLNNRKCLIGISKKHHYKEYNDAFFYEQNLDYIFDICMS
jgi:hypothetical protein